MLKRGSLYITIGAMVSMCSLSYGIFDRPSDDRPAEGLDIKYTDPETGQTRKRFAPVEAVGEMLTGRRNQTDQTYSPRRYDRYYDSRDRHEDRKDMSSYRASSRTARDGDYTYYNE